MQSLIPKIESQLSSLSVPIALQLPDGRQVAQAGARVTLAFKDWSELATLAAGQIGAHRPRTTSKAGSRSKARMRDLMAVAARPAARQPGRDATPAGGRSMLRRAKSLASHSPQQGRARRSSSTTTSPTISTRCGSIRAASTPAPTSATPDMTLAQAQEAKLDHICRKLMLAARRALPGHRRGLGRAADVGGRALRRRRHRHHAVEEPACACAAADRGEGPAGPGAHGAARLPRTRRVAGLRQDRLGGHVRACGPGQHAARTSARSMRCSSPAAW